MAVPADTSSESSVGIGPIPAGVASEVTLKISLPGISDDVTDKLIAQGQTPVGATPQELAKVLARETPIWADLIQQSGAKVE